MKAERNFLIASGLVRLIQRERLTTKDLVEGYFPPSPDRTHFVRVEPGASHLVLQSGPEGREERTKLTTSQAQALLQVCAGQVAFRRTHLRLASGLEAFLDRLEQPGPLDLLVVEFEDEAEAKAFSPPVWFGPEVTDDASYRKPVLAAAGVPSPVDLQSSNDAIIAFVDHLEANTATRQALTAQPGAEAKKTAAPAVNGGADHSPPRPAAAVVQGPVLAPPPAAAPEGQAHPQFEVVLAGLAHAITSKAEAPEAPEPPQVSQLKLPTRMRA